MPKKSHLEYVEDVNSSRSRSSDNLSKFSNSVSPLVRRIANFETCHSEQSESKAYPVRTRGNEGLKTYPFSSDSKVESDESNRRSKIIADIRRISETDSVSSTIPTSDYDENSRRFHVHIIPNHLHS